MLESLYFYHCLSYSLAGSDFNHTSEDLTFSSEGVMCIQIPINSADAALENDESFNVVLVTRDDDIVITRQTAVVTIIDESVIMIGFLETNYTTPEEDDSGRGALVEVCISIFSSGSQPIERDVSVYLSTMEGTATGM